MKVKGNKKTLIRWKIYIDRARMYIGYIQFFMIGFMFFDRFREHAIGQFIYDYVYISVPLAFLLFILLSLIIGRLDTWLGLREEELRNMSVSNPVLRNIQDGIDELKAEILKLHNQKLQ